MQTSLCEHSGLSSQLFNVLLHGLLFRDGQGVYILPLGIMAPGSSSMAQSHGRCWGSLAALCFENTSWNDWYSRGMALISEVSRLAIEVG